MTRKTQIRLGGGLFIFVVLGLAFVLFSMRIGEQTNTVIVNQLSDVANNNVELLKSVFSQDLRELSYIATYWEDVPQVADEKALSYLSEIGKRSRFLRLGVDLPDGTSYTSDGHTINVADMGYLEDVLEGNSVLTDLLVTKVDGKPCFAVVVPLWQEGKVVGALRGVYESNFLEDIVNLRTFDGHGYLHIVGANGVFLRKPENAQTLYPGENLFDVLQSASFRAPETLDSLRQAMLSQESGFADYTLGAERQFAQFAPVGLGRWYVFSAVPASHLQTQKNKIESAAALLLCVSGLLYAFLMFYVTWQEHAARARLHQERDYLQRVLDHIPLPLFITNATRHINFVNQAAIKLFHYSCAEELRGKPCSCLDTCICKTGDCAIEKMDRTGDTHTYYEQNGHNYMVNTAVLTADTAQEKNYIEAIQDISEIVEIQRVLEEKTLALETINENLSCGLLITTLDEQFSVLQCNHNYCEMIGEQEDAVLGECALKWIAPEDAEQTEQAIRSQLDEKNSVFYQYRLLCSGGERIWVALHGKRSQLQQKSVGIWLLTDITEMHEAEQELKISEERYRIAMRDSESILIDYSFATRTMFHSPKAKEVYGVPELMENAPESLLESGVIPERYRDDFLQMFDRIRAGEPKASCDFQARTSNGQMLWNRLALTAVFDSEGHAARAVGLLQNITREKAVEDQYKRESRYRELAGADATFYYEADLTQRRFLSGHEEIVYAYSDHATDDFDEIINLLIDYMVFEGDRETVRAHITWEALMHSYETGITRTTFEYRRPVDGKMIWVECSLHTFQDEETGTLRVVGCIRDVNEAKLRELSFQQQAQRDLLTGLYNKVTTQMLISEALSGAVDGTMGAFLLIDLDNFKQINDTMGHAFGDAVLVELARKLQANLTETELAGRLGGDEFVVFLRTASDLRQIAERADALCAMFRALCVGDEKYPVSGSIGLSVFPKDGRTFDSLYKTADFALYEAKRNGKNTHAFYAPGRIATQKNERFG